MGSRHTTNLNCNRTRLSIPVTDAVTGTAASHCFVQREPVKGSYAASVLNEMYQLEFNETKGERKALSQEDETFLQIMKEGAEKKGCRHELPLPFRNKGVTFPDNKHLAKGRLWSLRRQLIKSPDKLAAYKTKKD